MSEHVIALDPGGRSGWASARMSEDRFELTGTGVLQQALMADWLAEHQGVIYQFSGELRRPGSRAYDVVVAESWKPRRINGSMDWIEGDALLSAQHLGQIRWIARRSGARYVEYGPNQKHIFTASMPASLRALDEHSNEQHDQDARMHLWGYFMENWFTTKVDPEATVIFPL